MFSTLVLLDVTQRVRFGCFHLQSLRFFKKDCDISKIEYSDQVTANAATIWKVAGVSFVSGHVLVEFKQPKGKLSFCLHIMLHMVFAVYVRGSVLPMALG